MRRLVPVVVLCAALVAPPAAGAYSTGAYAGKHAGGAAIAFKVVAKKVRKGGKRITKRFVRLSGPFTHFESVLCADDFVYEVDMDFDDVTDIPIKPDGRFALTKQLKFSGRLAGAGRKSRAKGRVSFGFPDVPEHGDCTTGSLRWTARRAASSPSQTGDG